MRDALFAPVRAGYSKAQIDVGKIKTTLLEYPEFKAFAQRAMTLLTQWQQQMALQELSVGDNPKALIDEISEALLAQYADTALLNNYDVYQILMDYWNDTMQDDVYLLTQDGWLAGKVLRELVAEKGEKLKETPDIVIDKAKFKADLIAPSLIIARYYKTEQKQLDQLQADLDNATQELESYLEEHSGEDGLLAEALNDKDKVTKVTITARLKVTTDKEEKAALTQAKALFDAEADSKKALKEAQDQLDRTVFKHYATLSEDDIKTLIVNDKWHATLQNRIHAEIERIIQQLANRVKELEERYAESLPTISQSVDALSLKVAAHLKAMGLEV